MTSVQKFPTGVRRPFRTRATSNGTPAPVAPKAPIIVWFKHDLRTADHPGLAKALASGRPVICFFCFDAEVFSDQCTMLWTPRVVHGAVLDLQRRLTALNCPLVVRSGDTAVELLQLVADTGADVISCEDEVEHRWSALQLEVSDALPDSIQLKAWRAGIWPASTYTDNFNTFRKRRGAPAAPLPAPRPQVEQLALSLDCGTVPAQVDWDSALAAAASAPFAQPAAGTSVDSVDPTLWEEKGWVIEELLDVMEGGESAYSDLLQTYLRAEAGGQVSEAGARMLAVARKLEAVPGNRSGSFTAIFQPAMALGVLSRRQVYAAAAAFERERIGGLAGLAGFTTTHTQAAASAVECGDYHVGLAHILACQPTQAGTAQRRFWRWNGQITDYLVAEPVGGTTADTVTMLLVHGFGAFAEHWRRNIPDLAARGYRVIACTMPGFGPSEKAPQVYTTATWACFVRDFVINVVKEPVVIAGNSIGGVIPANACADHPHLFRGLVLINTAGSADLDWDPANPPAKKQQNELVVNGLSWLTFKYLQRGISKQLERLYPTRPFNADKFLNDEIYRASCDPCALQVLRSGFYLKPPRPLPYMLGQLYKGPVLVLQGVLDPLNRAGERADLLESRIEQATKVCIDAGHCPHDEVPELVNDAIDEFIVSRVLTDGAVRQPVLA